MNVEARQEWRSHWKLVLASALGASPVVAGCVYEQTHSYNFFLIGGIPVAMVAALLILSLRPLCPQQAFIKGVSYD